MNTILHSGNSTTFTVGDLPPHLSYDLLVYGTVTSTLTVRGEHGDLMTMTGPTGTVEATGIPTPEFVLDVQVPDLNGTTGAAFTVTGVLAGDADRTWEITSTSVYAHNGGVGIENAPVVVGGETDLHVSFSADDFSGTSVPKNFSDVVLTVMNYDANVIQLVDGNTVTLDSSGNWNRESNRGSGRAANRGPPGFLK